ncbi:MAG TPA: hypothetical protein VKX96_05835 [Chloroflexota bacterium]|nr:hypothetical protein [Chloroflexota bacterium]
MSDSIARAGDVADFRLAERGILNLPLGRCGPVYETPTSKPPAVCRLALRRGAFLWA